MESRAPAAPRRFNGKQNPWNWPAWNVSAHQERNSCSGPSPASPWLGEDLDTKVLDFSMEPWGCPRGIFPIWGEGGKSPALNHRNLGLGSLGIRGSPRLEVSKGRLGWIWDRGRIPCPWNGMSFEVNHSMIPWSCEDEGSRKNSNLEGRSRPFFLFSSLFYPKFWVSCLARIYSRLFSPSGWVQQVWKFRSHPTQNLPSPRYPNALPWFFSSFFPSSNSLPSSSVGISQLKKLNPNFPKLKLLGQNPYFELIPGWDWRWERWEKREWSSPS